MWLLLRFSFLFTQILHFSFHCIVYVRNFCIAWQTNVRRGNATCKWKNTIIQYEINLLQFNGGHAFQYSSSSSIPTVLWDSNDKHDKMNALRIKLHWEESKTHAKLKKKNKKRTNNERSNERGKKQIKLSTQPTKRWMEIYLPANFVHVFSRVVDAKIENMFSIKPFVAPGIA